MKKIYQSNSAILLSNILILVTVMTFIFGSLTAISISYQLYRDSYRNGISILRNLKKVNIDSHEDWKNWQKNNVNNTKRINIRIIDENSGKKYYSNRTRNLMHYRLKKIAIIPSLYRKGDDLYLYFSSKKTNIIYEVWIDLHQETRILKIIIYTIIVVWILVITISIIYALKVTKLLNAPLLNLKKQIYDIEEKKRGVIDIPDKPIEIKTLAQSFNSLLNNLYRQNEKEKIFVNNAAHELRTPVTAIKSHTQLIRRHGEKHPEVIKDSLKYITQEADHMQSLLDKLLLLARTDKTNELLLDKVNINNLMEEIINEMRVNIKQRIVKDVPNNIYIKGDLGSIKQIVVNLLSNASKYSSDNSVIKLSVINKNDQYVEVSIADFGRGISDEDKKHVFERFYRNDEVRGSIEGTGLGLSIAKKLADLNKAILVIEDNEPVGTIIKLNILRWKV